MRTIHLVNPAGSELYHTSGSGNGYDLLNRLTAFSRGTLNGGNDTIASPTDSQSWALDALGNMTTVTTNGTPQTRTYDSQNKLTTIGGNTLDYDADGAALTDEDGNLLIGGNGQVYQYD